MTEIESQANNICPICEKFKFTNWYDICPVCFWENDDCQNDDPNLDGGANHLSLNKYKARWNKLNEIMPTLMKKYNIIKTKLSHWEYDQLYVPRENIYAFVTDLSNQNIGIMLSFYNACQKYNYDYSTFAGLPFSNKKSIIDMNKEYLDIVFSKNPIGTCKKHKLKQMLEILEKSADVKKCWEENTPYICIQPNPEEF